MRIATFLLAGLLFLLLGANCAPPAAWQPAPGTTWHWQLTGALTIPASVEMADIDLFDTPPATISDLQAQGLTVICYFSAGSHENWRPDQASFDPAAIGLPLAAWPGERWLDVRATSVRNLMGARIALAGSKGCDGVEPDNVDGHGNNTGFPLSAADLLDYNRFLARTAHAAGLSIGLKNTVDLAATLEPDFDWALNEECLTFAECGSLQPFLDAGKAVFHVEYVDQPSQAPALHAATCGRPEIAGFSTLIASWDLDGFAMACS